METNKTTQREPAVVTIFGISGDLAARKLLPALYRLARDKVISENTYIVGITRRELDANKLLQDLEEQLKSTGQQVNSEAIAWMKQHLLVHVMNLDSVDDYRSLGEMLNKTEETVGVCLNRLFYLAVPAAAFGGIVEQLGVAGLNTGCTHGGSESRLLIEKPFGHDVKTANDLIDRILQSFKEEETYRIDHYLAKETVQNVLTLRSQNPLLEAAWGRKYIKSITVRAYESIGIENRVDFYEQTGAFRDVIQSHLLQLLGLVTMKIPATMNADSIHKSKAAILKQVNPPNAEDMSKSTIRGQYEGYRSEVDSADSNTETYAAATFSIDNDRWRGVPLRLETGKAMDVKRTEIIVEFKSKERPEEASNVLTMKLQPDEGIVLDVRIKKPGFSEDIETVPVDFYYKEKIDAVHPDAYERVLADALNGDRTLFATSDEVMACWVASQPILDAWSADKVPLSNYENGAARVV